MMAVIILLALYVPEKELLLAIMPIQMAILPYQPGDPLDFDVINVHSHDVNGFPIEIAGKPLLLLRA